MQEREKVSSKSGKNGTIKGTNRGLNFGNKSFSEKDNFVFIEGLPVPTSTKHLAYNSSVYTHSNLDKDCHSCFTEEGLHAKHG